jgi:hypothetical protein
VNLLHKTAFMDLEDEHRYDAMAGAVTIHSGGLSIAQFAQTFASQPISSPPSGQDISVVSGSSQLFVVNRGMHFERRVQMRSPADTSWQLTTDTDNFLAH